MEKTLELLSNAITNSVWLAPLVALLAGLVTSVMPCSISSVPLVIGYVGGLGNTKADKRRAFMLSLTFAAGMTITFVGLAAVATGLSHFFHHIEPYWFLFLGLLMVVMALQTWEVINLIPSSGIVSKNKKKGYFGALLSGMLSGLFSSHCATPALLMLLALVGKQGNLFKGIVLLLLFSVGHSVITIVAGTLTGFVTHLTQSSSYARTVKILKAVMGSIMVILALYMFFNSYGAFLE